MQYPTDTQFQIKNKKNHEKIQRIIQKNVIMKDDDLYNVHIFDIENFNSTNERNHKWPIVFH